MLKKEITYEDFDGNPAKEVLYFNLTKTEMIDLQMGEDGGIYERLQRIIETQDINAIYQELKKMILAAYGVRSDDGKRFTKNDQIREDFVSSAAFDALIIEMIEDVDQVVAFLKGAFPSELTAQIEKAEKDGTLDKIMAGQTDILQTAWNNPSLPPPPQS